jgi:integrating conjugative element membrane protein (TIGR03745 family)
MNNTRLTKWFPLLFIAIGAKAQAKIPQNQNPTQGQSDNILTMVLYYAYDILLIGGSIFVAFSAIYFMGHMWDMYKKTRERQATKQDLLTDGVIGAVLLLFSIWGLNFGLGILEQ